MFVYKSRPAPPPTPGPRGFGVQDFFPISRSSMAGRRWSFSNLTTSLGSLVEGLETTTWANSLPSLGLGRANSLGCNCKAAF